MTPTKKFEHAGYRVSIYQDPDPIPPNEFEDDELFLVTTKNRYFAPEHPDGFELDDIRDGKHKAEYDHFPLYAYIHSGVALSLGRGGQFSCPWDSGQIGFVLVKKSSFGSDTRKAAESLVEEWNNYLSGDVWFFTIADQDGNEVEAPGGGIYGIEEAEKEARDAAEQARAHETRESAEIERMMHL